MELRVALATATVICAIGAAHAQSDYEAVKNLCRIDRDSCIWYFAALSNGLRVVADYATANQIQPPYCIADSASPEALAHVIIQYVDSHPNQWHFGTPFMGFAALKEAYPCR